MVRDYNEAVLEYSLLSLGALELPVDTITPVCFLLERLGYSFNFHYSMTTTGLKSNQVNSKVNDMESNGLIETNGCIKLTEAGKCTIEELMFDEQDFNRVHIFLNNYIALPSNMQYRVAVVQFVIYSHIKYNGEDTLVSEKPNIVKSINNILGYDVEEENKLDEAMEFLRNILKWRKKDDISK